jgi:7-cyano-7-deazaguanine reductase
VRCDKTDRWAGLSGSASVYAVWSKATLDKMTTRPTPRLETFPNPRPARDYVIRFDCPEFTCLCPKTGQPDFAVIRVEYVPDLLCVELKSWKLYLWSFRDVGAFHEAVTNTILDDLVAVLGPRRMRVEAAFNVRGGITTTIVAEHVRSQHTAR